MPRAISRDELKRKMDSGDDYVLIEVLGPGEYEERHIKGAINIPLEHIGHTVKERFDQDQEIVVYCASYSCQASPIAAQKLDKLEFQNVYDYEGGKKEWMEAGYPTEEGV